MTGNSPENVVELEGAAASAAPETVQDTTPQSANAAESARQAARGSRRRIPMLWLNIASVIAGIAIWWIVSLLPGVQIPTPPAVVVEGGKLIANGTLAADIGASLVRVLIGFILGSLVAIPIGFLMGWYAIARALIEPYVQFFRMIPPLAIIPLAVVLMGIGEVPKIFVIFLAAFLACVVATFQGVIGVDRTLINAARVLGAKDSTIFLRVVVPASSPFIFVGMRVGLGSASATLVAAELIAAQQGLGFLMQQAQLYYNLASIFVALITIGILGLIMDRLLMAGERRITSWQELR
jgi:NitT/TauT family transport system permease protein